MKTFLVLSTLLLSFQSFAQSVATNKCYDAAKSQALYFAVHEDYVLTADEFDKHFGLVDVVADKDMEYWTFGDGSLNIFLTLDASGTHCKLIEISSGQEDQD